MEDYEKKLRSLIQEMMTQKDVDLAKEEKEIVEERLAKMFEDNEGLKARLETLEKQPAKQIQLPIPGTDETKTFLYRGFDMRKQGMSLGLDDKDREIASKFLIDTIRKADMQEGTTTEGGYLVPDEYADSVLAFARLNSVALRDARIYPMSTDVMRIPAESSNVSVAWTAEEIALTASNPTFAEVALTAQKLGAYSTASNELLADSKFDIVSMLTSQFGEAIGQEIDNQTFNGGTWTGALSGATTNTVSCAATGTSPNRNIQITVDELSEAISKLSTNKLMGAKFYVSRNALHYIRIQEDGAGNKVWAQPGNGVPGTIYEYPYEIVEQLPATPDASSGFVVFGNLNNYVIGQRKGNWTLEADPYGKFLEYQTRFRVVTRWDGDLGLEAGLCIIKTHA